MDESLKANRKQAGADALTVGGPSERTDEIVREGTMYSRFRLDRLVARGGAGDVYLAYDTHHNRVVALKLVRVGGQDPELLASERMGTELQHAAEGITPQVVRILESGEEAGFFYVVTEFAQGESLGQILSKSGALSPKRSIRIAMELCRFVETLQSSSSEGRVGMIIHGDIKPENVILVGESEIRIVDFGIARILTRKSSTQNLFGTLPYVAPERMEHGQVDKLSDLWSVAVILYQIVVGALPFDDSDLDRGLVQNLRPVPEEIPPTLAAIIRKSLNPNPKERYSTPSELLQALAAFLQTSEFAEWSRASELLTPSRPSIAVVYDHKTKRILNTGDIRKRLEDGAAGKRTTRRTSRYPDNPAVNLEYNELHDFVTGTSEQLRRRVDSVASSVSQLRSEFMEIKTLLEARPRAFARKSSSP